MEKGERRKEGRKTYAKTPIAINLVHVEFLCYTLHVVVAGGSFCLYW